MEQLDPSSNIVIMLRAIRENLFKKFAPVSKNGLRFFFYKSESTVVRQDPYINRPHPVTSVCVCLRHEVVYTS